VCNAGKNPGISKKKFLAFMQLLKVVSSTQHLFRFVPSIFLQVVSVANSIKDVEDIILQLEAGPLNMQWKFR